MKYFFCFALFFSTSCLYAQQDSIGAAEAENYVGKTVVICDKITQARLDNISKDEPNVLFTGSDYEHRTLALIFSKRALRRFPYNPNTKMINSKFCVRGKVAMYKGKPAIYIKNDNQLNVSE